MINEEGVVVNDGDLLLGREQPFMIRAVGDGGLAGAGKTEDRHRRLVADLLDAAVRGHHVLQCADGPGQGQGALFALAKRPKPENGD
jgi:hypothetical protein